MEYGPNKGPRVGDNNITETSLPNVTNVFAVTTDMPVNTESDTEQIFVSTIPSQRDDANSSTTIDDNDNITTKRPKIKYDTTLEYDDESTTTSQYALIDSMTPTLLAIDLNRIENTTALDSGKTVQPIQCNSVNDCAPNEMCTNNKCTKICDPTNNSNRTGVDCMQGICQ